MLQHAVDAEAHLQSARSSPGGCRRRRDRWPRAAACGRSRRRCPSRLDDSRIGSCSAIHVETSRWAPTWRCGRHLRPVQPFERAGDGVRRGGDRPRCLQAGGALQVVHHPRLVGSSMAARGVGHAGHRDHPVLQRELLVDVARSAGSRMIASRLKNRMWSWRQSAMRRRSSEACSPAGSAFAERLARPAAARRARSRAAPELISPLLTSRFAQSVLRRWRSRTARAGRG